MPYTWKLFSNHDPIELSESSQVMGLFLQTTTEHSDRDFGRLSPSTFQNTINTGVAVRPHPKTSWTRVSCAFNGNGMVIAIVYRYIKHRKEWSVSVGFDQSLLPPPSPGNNTNEGQYLTFANVLEKQIKADLTAIDNRIDSFIMIDDVSLVGSTANETPDGFEQEATQRLTKIGELIWLAKGGQSVFSGGTYSSNGINSSRWTYDKVSNPGIKGYAKTDGGKLCVTKVTWS